MSAEQSRPGEPSQNRLPSTPRIIKTRATLDTEPAAVKRTPTPGQPRFRRAVTTAVTPNWRRDVQSPRHNAPDSASVVSSSQVSPLDTSQPSISSSFQDRWHGRHQATPLVDPQNDYLANWESLAHLIAPSPDTAGAGGRSPNRLATSPSSVLAGRGLRDMPSVSTLGRTAARNIPGSLPETDEEREEDLTFSAVLSSSPPALGSGLSFGEASDGMSIASGTGTDGSVHRSITPTQQNYGATQETSTPQGDSPSKASEQLA